MHEIGEDQEALEAFARLDVRLNLERPEVNGKRLTIIHKGYGSRYLFGIEKFVKNIQNGWHSGFVNEVTRYAKVEKIRELYLGKRHYRFINDWLGRE